jgi:lipid-A-disaccharide synthase
VTGFIEPLIKIPFLIALGRKLKEFLKQRRPSAVICVDYYGFNRRLLSWAKEAGVPAYYFISPQVWASRPGRVQILKTLVKKMLVIFPFEAEIYERAHVPVEFVGHPLLDLITEPPESRPDETCPKIGILPGSRTSELQRHLPVMFAAFERMKQTHPEIQGHLFASANQPDSAYGQLPKGVTLIRESNYNKRRELSLALCSSGTATLENALLGIPMVVIYRLSWPTYLIARALVNIKFISMANILAGKSVVPELIQHRASPNKISEAANRFIDDKDYASSVRKALIEVRRSLGLPGATMRAAKIILSELNRATS